MKNMIMSAARISLGWIFLWAFVDKLFGFGFATEAGNAWMNGVSPTAGFLKFGTKGAFAEIFQGLAGVAIVDWLFMAGLLLIGLSLILGVGLRIAAYSGTALMLLLWLAVFPLANNPIIDEHVIYAFLLWLLTLNNAGDYFGLGKLWSKTKLVKTYPILK